MRQLVWIPVGALVGFATSFIFGDLITLPIDLYYLIYFSVIITFFALYVRRTDLDLKEWWSRRLVWGIVLGVVVGVLMVQNILSRPETEKLTGAHLAWAVLWRGLVYGGVDGLPLFAFPWIVTWRAVSGEEAKGMGAKVGAGILAWICILAVTTAYHLGYSDFRSKKIVQPNIGSTIMSLPTLLSANPVGSPISHIFLHVAAVIHAPYTELFLPPHREAPR